MRLSCLLFASLTVAACNDKNGYQNYGDGGAPSITGLVSIAITPADQTLVVANGKPATLIYTAIGTFDSGKTEDITNRVGWGLDDAGIGNFAGPKLTTNTAHGGRTNVRAQAGTIGGLTTVKVKLTNVFVDPSTSDLGSDPTTKFGGTMDPSRAPDVVYPNDGVLVPPNLGKLEVHFHPGTSNTLFAVHYDNDITDVTIYTRCTEPTNGGCIVTPDPSVWAWVAETNRGYAQGVAISVQGTDDAGSAVGVSGATNVSFSQDDIDGGFYYWTTSNGTGIMRFDFASTQTTADQYLDTSLTGGTCVGCHALSRDGTKLVAEAGGQNDGRLLILDVGMRTPIVPFGQPPKSIFESWNPDGSQFVGVYADNNATDYNLEIYDGTSGDVTQTIDVGDDATNPSDHPDWSPDGSSIAYVRVGIAQTCQRMFNGEIRIVQNVGGAWGAPLTLVPMQDGVNHYYPAFSPDGTVIVYDESHCPAGAGNMDHYCDADTDPSAKLWTVAPVAGATPIQLANADAPGVADGATTDLTDTFPKWSPFVFQRTSEFGSKLEWLTFASTRQYGLRTPPAGGDENPSGTLLWMVAVDPDQAANGADGSYKAFALPFQDLTTSNHIAQWTTQVVPVIP